MLRAMLRLLWFEYISNDHNNKNHVLYINATKSETRLLTFSFMAFIVVEWLLSFLLESQIDEAQTTHFIRHHQQKLFCYCLI